MNVGYLSVCHCVCVLYAFNLCRSFKTVQLSCKASKLRKQARKHVRKQASRQATCKQAVKQGIMNALRRIKGALPSSTNLSSF